MYPLINVMNLIAFHYVVKTLIQGVKEGIEFHDAEHEAKLENQEESDFSTMPKGIDETYKYDEGDVAEGFRAVGSGPYRTKSSIHTWFTLGDQSSLYPMTFATSLHPEYIHEIKTDIEKTKEAIETICKRQAIK